MISRVMNSTSGEGGNHSEQREQRLLQLHPALRQDLVNISSGATHMIHFTCKMPDMRTGNPDFIDQVIQVGRRLGPGGENWDKMPVSNRRGTVRRLIGAK